jgi:hypothetical protein
MAIILSGGSRPTTLCFPLAAGRTRGLREPWAVFRDRRVWTVGGDWECVNSEDDLETVCLYVREAQDRLENKHQ